MKIGEVLTKAGLILFTMGLLIIGATLLVPVEKWVKRSTTLDEGTDIHILHHYEKFLAYNFTINHQLYRNLSIELWIHSKFPKNISLTSNSLNVRLYDTTQYTSRFPITPSELRDGIKFEIVNIWSGYIVFDPIFLKVITPFSRREYYARRINLIDILCDRVWDLIKRKELKIQGFSFRFCNLTIFGEAIEKSGHRFNLYILDEGNYTCYFKGLNFKAYWSGVNASSHKFTIYDYPFSLSKVYFVFELLKEFNIERERFTIIVPKENRFVNKAVKFFNKTPQAIDNITIMCILREEKNQKFSFYLFRGSELYFSGEGKSYYEINMSIPPWESASSFNLIIEKDVSEKVKISIDIIKSWYKTLSYEILLKIFANYSRIIVDDLVDYRITLLWEEKVRKPLNKLLMIGGTITILGVCSLFVSYLMKRNKRSNSMYLN